LILVDSEVIKVETALILHMKTSRILLIRSSTLL